VHGAEIGLVGGIGGFLLGLFVVLTPPEGLTLELATVLATTLGGALLGAWVASLVGAAVPNSRLKRYAADIEAGRVLLMVDVRPSRIEEVRELVHRRHPEASGGAWNRRCRRFLRLYRRSRCSTHHPNRDDGRSRADPGCQTGPHGPAFSLGGRPPGTGTAASA
jgi:hypothetical protein